MKINDKFFVFQRISGIITDSLGFWTDFMVGLCHNHSILEVSPNPIVLYDMEGRVVDLLPWTGE